MCGRYTLHADANRIGELFGLEHVPDLAPRYNIAPTQDVPVVREDGGRRACVLLRWGLVPSWAADLKGSARLINARAETVATRPAFRAAFRRRRCLLVADGYYEWRGAGRAEEPFYFTLKDGSPFAFAGLWEHWHHGGQTLESCALLTTDANELGQPVHDRMPVLLDPKTWDAWLDPDVDDPGALGELLRPYPASRMRRVAVSPAVNNPRHDAPDCIRASAQTGTD